MKKPVKTQFKGHMERVTVLTVLLYLISLKIKSQRHTNNRQSYG